MSVDLRLVSIHASAREATTRCWNAPGNGRSFNPRLREGGDPMPGLLRIPPRCFNPRLREGGDLPADGLPEPMGVSIHASAREATPQSIWVIVHTLFQSTPPRGRRRETHSSFTVWNMFQSTPPRGRRPNGRAIESFYLFVSIHASAREATKSGGDYHLAVGFVSIHASAREATRRVAG